MKNSSKNRLKIILTGLMLTGFTFSFANVKGSWDPTCQNSNDTIDTKGPDQLLIDQSRRFLTTKDGKPFFWLGDTGWQLFSKLDEGDVLKYLWDRKHKQFNVIQAHMLDWDIRKPNAYGHIPFENYNIDKPNEQYWQHADFIVRQAADIGLYLALLPIWASSHIEIDDEQGGPGVEQKSPGSLAPTPAEAYRYGKFVGERYKKYSNIVWVLGGDTRPTKHEVYDALARGITDGYANGDPGRVLMSYHPPGGTYRPPATSTGEFYHNKPWMDFNMIQSGHRIGNKNYERIYEDYQRTPVKPTFDSEPCYERIPVKHKFARGQFTAWHLRRRGYWSVLSGGFGFSYGGNGIWQMDAPGKIQKYTHHNFYWYDALHYEGAYDMAHIRRLFESRPFLNPERIPDQSIIVSDQGMVDDRIQAARASDFSYYIIYITNGRPFEVDLSQFRGDQVNCWWYNPRDGKVYDSEYQPADNPFMVLSKVKKYSFDPPGDTAQENDWVLILDDATKNYPKPGPIFED